MYIYMYNCHSAARQRHIRITVTVVC